MPKKKLKKPKKVQHAPTWDYRQVIDYIEEKYKINVRDYAGKFAHPEIDDKVPYLDFWHWLIDHDFSDMYNGSYQWIWVTEHLENKKTPPWVKEILQKIYDEFQEDDMQFWIEW